MPFKRYLLVMSLILFSLPSLAEVYDPEVFNEHSESESLPYEEEFSPTENEEQNYEIEREEFSPSESGQGSWIDHEEEAPSFEAYQ